MTEPRQINLLQVGNMQERRALEDSHLAFFPKKQDRQFKAAVPRTSIPHQGFDDNSNCEQRPQPFCKGDRITNGFSTYQWYEYKPLPSSTSIRLLEIQPRSPHESALRCRIRIISMACLPIYDALSYAWGTAKETENLECDGKVVKVRRNLLNALQRLRHINNVQWIWVDAICMNQQDKEEKDKQIPLMADIYRMAHRVIVWIGEDNHAQAKPAFDIVERLSLDGARTLHALSHDPSRHVLSSFYSQHWFSRVWIIQEVARARTVEVLWGAEKVSWKHVCRAAAEIRTFSYRMIWHTPGLDAGNAYMLHQFPAKDGRSLLYWLEASRKFDSSLPNDRVYSLLGLTTNSGTGDNRLTFQPNHRKKTRSLFKQVAMISMKQLQTLDVLAAVQHDTVKSYRPTWVPRWNFSHSVTIAQLDPELQGFTASRHLPGPRFEWRGKYGQILRVNGVVFDRVTEISEIISGTDNISEQTTRLVKILAKVLATRHSYPTSEDIHHVCCWTVTAGKDHYGMLVTDTPGHLTDFSQFWSCRKLVTTHARRWMDENEKVDRFIHAALASCRGRRLFHTAKGYIGLGSAALRPDDIISVLCGGTVPMALRKTIRQSRSHNQYLLVGETYVHGIMHGEAVNENLRGKAVLASFEIV